ncbi:MAG: hypothetical protein LBD97_04160 [Bifidobacteriaceae bacterium]|jgi:hypothetical protein|nr:hypothetical protein [Bifidobacteriaceae bacterium]
MTIRLSARRVKAAAMGAMLAVGFALAAGGSAFADDERLPNALQTWWDGNVLNVPWYGAPEYETIADDAFQHNAVAVPGDWIHRTLVVRNNGPCPGTLTVEILNPITTVGEDTVNDDDPAVAPGRTGFAGMSEVHWDVGGVLGSSSFADLYDHQQLASVPVPKGGTVRVQMAYAFPYDETEGKNLGHISQAIKWDVGLGLRGDYCAGPGPTGPSSGDETDTARTETPGTPGGGGLEYTGANILFGVISAGFLLAAGVVAVWRSNSRREDLAS